MDGDLVGEELNTLAVFAHVPVGDCRIGVRGMRGLPVRCIASSIRRKAGNQGEAESVRKLAVKPFSSPIPTFPLDGVYRPGT